MISSYEFSTPTWSHLLLPPQENELTWQFPLIWFGSSYPTINIFSNPKLNNHSLQIDYTHPILVLQTQIESLFNLIQQLHLLISVFRANSHQQDIKMSTFFSCFGFSSSTQVSDYAEGSSPETKSPSSEKPKRTPKSKGAPIVVSYFPVNHYPSRL